ncbi:hypothetical protein NQZ79_g662 [Umbelopsis isabellina]|nr:hypothetical protein NQZ79_g662 [Umbelopsis isabellina]
MVRDRIYGCFSCCVSSLFGILFTVVFAGGWIGTVIWGLYTTTKYIHEIQSMAATNCTILDATMNDNDDDSGWLIHAFYMVPVQLGVPANTTKISILDGTDYNAHYSVNQTLSCWVSISNFDTVTLSPFHVDAGTIVGLVMFILMALPVFIGVLYVAFLGFALVCTIISNCFACLKRKRRQSFSPVEATESFQVDDGGYNLNNRSQV